MGAQIRPHDTKNKPALTLPTTVTRASHFNLRKYHWDRQQCEGSSYQRGFAEKTLHGIAADKSSLDCRKNNFRNRYSIVQWDCRRSRSRHTNNSTVGPPKCPFGIGPQHHLSAGIVGGERIPDQNHRIISRVALGLLEHRWNRWTSSGSLSGRSKVASGVAGHLHFLGLLEHRF